MISPGMCFSYKRELLHGDIHSSRDQYFLALYTRDATISAATTTYTVAGEVTGPGYTAGGKALTGFNVTGRVFACLDFSSPEWLNATIRARGGLIYNRSKGNRAVAVIDFGGDITSTLGTFSVDLPTPGDDTSLIRI